MLRIINVIYIYLAIIILLILFNLGYIIYEKIINKKISNNTSKYKKIILNDLKHKKINQNSIDYFSRKLKNINNLRAYNSVITELIKTKSKKMDEYFNKYAVIFNRLSYHYIKYESMKKAYFAYVIRTCYFKKEVASGQVIDFIFSIIKDKSIYARENAMLFLYTNGCEELVVDALKIICKNNLYYNQILLANDLLKFRGNEKRLKDKLLLNYDNFSDEFKISIINYFRFSKSNDYLQFFLTKLENRNINKEVYLALLRLFGKYKEENALKYLLESLNLKGDELFEYRLVSASSLKIYQSDVVKNALINALKDKNWFVRKNAALSLANFELSDDDLREINSDRYAKEMLDFIMEEKEVVK
ncbi:MAG: HEAT repeat domain-containing protein [Bacilli bacterium]|nr:HEAT repeat domain-containing protein [Bacilli bacterium]